MNIGARSKMMRQTSSVLLQAIKMMNSTLVDVQHNRKMKNLTTCYIKDGGCTKQATNLSRRSVVS
jgi:hypothetical protein